jgi:pimeloyl-ACP methyl ester carboxylesterase
MATSDRIHRTASADGTTIAGRVHGHGPPLVLVPGGPADGETGWPGLLPLLEPHAACYALNTRGRGLSDDHADHRHERLVEDVVAFVDSIEDAVVLFGHSAGATHVLDAAAVSSSVRAVALYEPTLAELADDRAAADFAAGFEAVTEAAEGGRLRDAARLFLERLARATDEELALAEEVDAFSDMAPLVPVVLAEAARSGPPNVSDLAILDRIDVPVLILIGERTHPFYRGVAQYLQGRLADVEVREVPGVAHLAPETHPEAVAVELIRLLEADAARVEVGR